MGHKLASAKNSLTPLDCENNINPLPPHTTDLPVVLADECFTVALPLPPPTPNKQTNKYTLSTTTSHRQNTLSEIHWHKTTINHL